MDKSELLDWLQREQEQWRALLSEIDPARMDQPGVNGDWSMNDIVGHLNGWQAKLVASLEAAGRGEPEPPPPWPPSRVTVDQINDWIYETNRERPPAEILADTERQFEQLVATVNKLPDDVRIDSTDHAVWLGEQVFPAGDFFNHFHEDHEQDVRAWLARGAQ